MAPVPEQFTAAVAANDLVQLERGGFDARDRRTEGIALGVSDTLVLVALLSDRIDLDGYEVLHVADITTCRREFERKDFYRRALELKGQLPATPVSVDLSGLPALLTSAQALFPLLTIHRERLFPGECDIGRLKLHSEDAFAIHYIDPSAKWRDEPGHYRYTDVTRVNFGGEYEAALALVAGVGDGPKP
jgi:hypothetical protein